MIGENFIAATLDYAFDYERITSEINSCGEFFFDTPAHSGHVEAGLSGRIPFMSESVENYRRIDHGSGDGRLERKELRGIRSLYLRNSTTGDALRNSSYRFTKTLAHASWHWRAELKDRIPYTIECIESLPYDPLGAVRAFACENTFMPTHRDVEPGPDARDRSRAIGISLIPATGGVGMLVWNRAGRCVEEVRGHCIMFDDGCWHGVPMTQGMRITIRVFGELNFERLGGHLDRHFPVA